METLVPRSQTPLDDRRQLLPTSDVLQAACQLLFSVLREHRQVIANLIAKKLTSSRSINVVMA